MHPPQLPSHQPGGQWHCTAGGRATQPSMRAPKSPRRCCATFASASSGWSPASASASASAGSGSTHWAVPRTTMMQNCTSQLGIALSSAHIHATNTSVWQVSRAGLSRCISATRTLVVVVNSTTVRTGPTITAEARAAAAAVSSGRGWGGLLGCGAGKHFAMEARLLWQEVCGALRQLCLCGLRTRARAGAPVYRTRMGAHVTKCSK
jgi:hypothetical protein